MMSDEKIKEEDLVQPPDMYKYWLIVYHGDEDKPKIVHMAAYEKEPTQEVAQSLMQELLTNKTFGFPEEMLKEMKIAEITDELAREIMSLNADSLACEEHNMENPGDE